VFNSQDLDSLKGSGLIGLAPVPEHKEELEDPFHHGIPGFIAQLMHDHELMNDFEP